MSGSLFPQTQHTRVNYNADEAIGSEIRIPCENRSILVGHAAVDFCRKSLATKKPAELQAFSQQWDTVKMLFQNSA